MKEYDFYRALCDDDITSINKVSQSKQEHFVQNLKAKGLSIKQTDQSIKLIDPVNYYNKQMIQQAVNEKFNDFDVQFIYETDSTNKLIRNFDNNKAILLAEYQHSGHGRRGKNWLSPLGTNIYLSMKFTADFGHKISLYPIYIATIIAEFLSKSIKQVAIKWPNDIYIANKKCMGILLESIYQGKSPIIILGIGINLLINKHQQAQIDQAVTSLYEHTDDKSITDKNHLLAQLLPKLLLANQEYKNINKNRIIENFEKYNWLKKRTFNIDDNKQKHIGQYFSLNADGSLVAIVNEQQKTFYAADISIKGTVNE